MRGLSDDDDQYKDRKRGISKWGKHAVSGVVLAMILYTCWKLNELGSLSDLSYSERLGFDITEFENINFANYFDKLRPVDSLNASAVFNSINSVVDAVAGTIQPNGVSIFTGYIPEGTLFYHSGMMEGSSFPSSPEWVSVNWEYSFSFGSSHSGVFRPGEPFKGPRPRPVSPNENFKARLLTFQNVKPLNKIIVLEGASAKKADDGTMDVHNVLAGKNFTSFYGRDERLLAKYICEWGKEKYNGLDGIVRMETGFEIIFCDFESDKLELVANDTFHDDPEILNFPMPLPYNESLGQNQDLKNDTGIVLDDARYKMFEHLKYVRGWDNFVRHFEPETRIKIDFRGFTTVLNKTYVNPDTYLRRLKDTPEEIRQEYTDAIEKIYTLNADNINFWDGNNWQEYTRHIVNKFYPSLALLRESYKEYISENPKKFTSLALNLTFITSQYYARYHGYDVDNDDATKHAVWELTFPKKPLQSDSDVLIWSSIAKVVEDIVTEMFSQFEFARTLADVEFNEVEKIVPELEKSAMEHADSVENLLKQLDWTIETGCQEKCSSDSICFVPPWGPNPLRRFINEQTGREQDENGVWRTKKECNCLKLTDLVGYPDIVVND